MNFDLIAYFVSNPFIVFLFISMLITMSVIVIKFGLSNTSAYKPARTVRSYRQINSR